MESSGARKKQLPGVSILLSLSLNFGLIYFFLKRPFFFFFLFEIIPPEAKHVSAVALSKN